MGNFLKRMFTPKYNKQAQEAAAEKLINLKKDIEKNVPHHNLVDVISKMVDNSGNPVSDEVDKFHSMCDHFGDELANSKLDLNNILSDDISSKNNSHSANAINAASSYLDSCIRIYEQLKDLEFESGVSFYPQIKNSFDQANNDYKKFERNVKKLAKKDSFGGPARDALGELTSDLKSNNDELNQQLESLSDIFESGEHVEKIKKKNKDTGETVTIKLGSKTERSMSLAKMTAPSVTKLMEKAAEEKDAKKRAILISKSVAALRGLVNDNLESKSNTIKNRLGRKRIDEAGKKFNALCSTLDRLAGNFRKADGDQQKFESLNSLTLSKLEKQIQLVRRDLKNTGIAQNVFKTATKVGDIAKVLETGKPLNSENTDSKNQSELNPGSKSNAKNDNVNDSNSETSDNAVPDGATEPVEKTAEQLKIDNLYLKAAGGDMKSIEDLRSMAKSGDKDALDALKKLADKETSGVKLGAQQYASRILFADFSPDSDAVKKGRTKLEGIDKVHARPTPGVDDTYGASNESLRGLSYDGDALFKKLDENTALELTRHLKIRKILENMLTTREDAHGNKINPPESVRVRNMEDLIDYVNGTEADAAHAEKVLMVMGCRYGVADALAWYTGRAKNKLDLVAGLDADSKKLAQKALTDNAAWLELAAKAIHQAGVYRNAYSAFMAWPETAARKGSATVAEVYTALQGGGYAVNLCLQGLKAAEGTPGVSKQERYNAIYDLYIPACRQVAHPLAILNDLGGTGAPVTNAAVLANIHTIANLIQGAGGDNDETETYAKAVAIQNFRSENDCASSAVEVFDLLAHNTNPVPAISQAFVAAGANAWKQNFDLLNRYNLLYAGLNAAIADGAIVRGALPAGNAMNAQGNVLAALVVNNNVFQATKSFCKIDGKSDGIDKGSLDRLVSLGASGVNEARYVLHNLAVMANDPLTNNVKNAILNGGGAAAKNVTINNYSAANMGVAIDTVWGQINALPVSAEVKDLVAGAMYMGYDVTAGADNTMNNPVPKQNLTKLVFGAVAENADCVTALQTMAGKFAGGQPLAGMANKPNNNDGAVDQRFTNANGLVTAGALFNRKQTVIADAAWTADPLTPGSEFAVALLEVTFKGQLADGNMYNGANNLSDAAFTKIKNAAKSNNADALKALKILSTLADANVDAGIKAEAARDYESYVATAKTAARLVGKRGDTADRKEAMSKNRDRITNEEVKQQLETAQLHANPDNRKAAREQLKAWADTDNNDNFERRRDAALALRFLKEADAQAKTDSEREADRVLDAAKVHLNLSDKILVHKSTYNTDDGLQARTGLLERASNVGKSGDRFVSILRALSGANTPSIDAKVIEDYKSKLTIAETRRAEEEKKRTATGRYSDNAQTDYGDVVKNVKPLR